MLPGFIWAGFFNPFKIDVAFKCKTFGTLLAAGEYGRARLMLHALGGRDPEVRWALDTVPLVAPARQSLNVVDSKDVSA